MKCGISFFLFFSLLSLNPLYSIEEAFLIPPFLGLHPSKNDWKQISFLQEGSFRSVQKSYKIIAFGNSYKGMIRRGHVQDSASNWSWGFRSGIGYMPKEESWSIVASYTQFHSRVFEGGESQNSMFIPAWKENSSLAAVDNGMLSSSWRLYVNLADVEFGRRFKPMRAVFLHPHIGVRGAWMYQKVKASLLSSVEPSTGVFLGNNCAGIGLRSGLDSLWKAGHGVSLFGDGAVSLLAGYYNVGQNLMTFPRNDSNSIGSIATAEMSFGFQYEKPVYGKMVTFRMGYEMNYMFNQMRLTDWVTNTRGAASDAHNGVALQGVTVNLRLDF